MKFALYSDIHAQIPQLDAVQAAVAKENVDKVIVIGDLVMLGPDSDKVVQRLMDSPEIDVIVGNLDLWVVNKRWETHEPKSPHQAWMFEMAKKTREQMTEQQLEWLGKRPFSITYTPARGHDFHIFHATPNDIGDDDAIPLRLTDEQVKEKIKGETADVMAFGHVHGAYVREIGKQTLVCAAYAIVEYLGDGEWRCEAKRVEYDFEAQAKYNEDSWIEHGERIASMIRTGKFWNPEHMPH
jgi:predicted phosphodiesterase